MVDLAGALQHLDLARREDFYLAARCLLVSRQADLALFDRAFDLFWRAALLHLVRGSVPARAEGPSLAGSARNWTEAAGDPSRPATDRDALDAQQALLASRAERLRRVDFARMTSEELRAVQRWIIALPWPQGRRRVRRQQPGAGRRLDLRRSLRASLTRGGEILSWHRLRPKTRPRPLVVLADVSGSMSRYSQILMQFAYGLLGRGRRRVEVFTFGTRLTRITRQLRHRLPEEALANVAQRVPDWSGGTRIGEALKTFNYDWGRRVLGGGAVVLLISDGLERGDVQLLRREVARLQRTCFRLIWLNPLSGSPRYQPRAGGMRAALPFVDDFLPIHNLASLEDLGARLAELDTLRMGSRMR
jgi:uncharacterized protein with von Willebrand factor type A (vWA) domain